MMLSKKSIKTFNHTCLPCAYAEACASAKATATRGQRKRKRQRRQSGNRDLAEFT